MSLYVYIVGKGIAGRDYYLRLGYCVEAISALVAFLVANSVSRAVIRQMCG